MSTEQPVIDVRNLVKRYGDKTVVAGITFSVAEGEIFGLLGPNGAGKSTTISILSTLLGFDEGTVKIAGLDLAKEKEAVKGLIGLVPQDLAIYSSLSARDNLSFIGRIYGLSGRLLDARVAEVLALTGLADRAGDPAGNFSGGMKRRLNIGAGLMHKPRILFLDEPTVGVDPQSRNFIFEHIERLNEEGMAVVYTTHYMEEAERLCDRVAIMDGGRLLAIDTVSGLIGLAKGGLILLGVPAESAETAREVFESQDLRSVTAPGGRLKIEAHRVDEAVPKVIALCKGQNIPILSLEMLRPDLETVFLHLTGRRLRD
jgi:ABC-2 type transport system ATP-binding protein